MEEPMDIDSLDNDFDNKENTVHHSNVLPRTPCTEKGYEELDVSELNMKLRYSLTPTSSPMSKSVSVNCPENKLDNGHPNIHVIESCQMTRSLNTTVSSNDTSKLNKTPLRALSTEPIGDNNKSVLQLLVSKGIDNVTITVDNVQDDENLSLPSTSSSSLTHTPEAVTPTKELPKEDGGSPIIRGLKSVFSMFRPSQSPIAPTDEKPQNEIIVTDTETQKLFESTPISSHKYKESILRKSPHKESITFTDDLEKELLWKEDSTIIFSQEKVPIHKLFPEETPIKFTEKPTEALNETVEFMDISYNDSALADKTITNNYSIKNITKSEMTFGDSDSEFVDCETTFTKDVSLLEMKKSVKDINEDPVIEGTVKLSEKPEHNDINNESINLDKSNDTIKNENVAECVETNQNVDDANKTYLPEENVQVTCATSQSQIANMICNLNLTSSISENIMTQIVADSNITDDTKHDVDNTFNNKLSNQTMNLDITINLDSNNHTIPIDQNSTIDILTSIENITEEIEECNSTSNPKSIANITDFCKSEYYEKTLPNDIPLPAEDDIDTNVKSRPSSSLNNELELNNVIKLDIPTKQCDTTDENVNPNDTITSTANNPVLISNDHDVTITILTEEIKKQNDADNLSIQLNEEVKLLSSERPFVVSDNVIECQKPSITEVTDLQISNNITYEPCEDVSSTLPTTQISDESPNFENQSKETSSDDKQTDMQVLDLVSENVNANNISNDIANTNEEEVIISEDNSPYVSLSAPIKEMDCQQVLIGNDEIRTAFDSKPILPECRPSSPKIVSRGNYNFNFDEMDDPFATKTKIRSSLSPEKTNISTDLVEKVSDISQDIEIKVSNKTTKDKRKSQHLKRKTGIHNRTDTTLNASQMSVSDTQENNDLEKTIINQQFSTVADNLNSNEKISETSEPDINQENISPVGEKIEVVQEQNDIDTKVPTSSEAEVTLTEYTADVSSPPPTDNTLPKNVFNIPEIEDSGFNPFATVLKMRHSPDRSVINDVEEVANESHEDFNCSSSSKATDSKNLTVREINTEDEDTIEGPFLEADELNNIDKISDFDGEKVDMIQFSDINNDEIEENEEGEMFIDAEAFEFLLNQNKPMVADSGKESLFLKFDPLFAKRMSSIQDRKQSSPKKATKQLPPGSSSLDISGIPGPSNVIDMSYEITNNTTFEDKCDESINNTITKPTMAVTPAVNCAVSPRNKTITPTRSNRRSFTFTSPAIAVIDRLLSMSANNSILGQDSTVVHVSNEQHEAELALTQLRELLAEKEISVHQLKCESNELKYRLETLESQMSRLEEENNQKLQNINSLNEKLAEKTRDNKNMAVVVEEYERTIASLIAEKEQEKRLREEERTQLIRERDEQTAHLSNMECSFNDLHSKYEKSKGIILAYKVNEDTYRKTIKDFESNFAKVQNNYDLLKQHATSKLNHANQELEKINRAHEAEILKLHTMLKRKEVEITSLEESLAQKTKANDELAAICDELINKVG